jgi:asparagine synthase (glutamine-hydrolysing)
MIFFDNPQKKELYASDFSSVVGDRDSLEILLQAYDRSDAADFVERTAHTDVQLYLPDDLLVKMDIASMANSLEMRSPLLDHKVMEFAAALPRHLKLRGLSDKKYLLKAAFRQLLPPSILKRPKMGFGIPLDVWLRGDLKELAYDVLLDSTAAGRGYFRTEVVRRYLDEHLAGVAHHQYRIWNLLMLELWQRTYLDAPRQSLQGERCFELSGITA